MKSSSSVVIGDFIKDKLSMHTLFEHKSNNKTVNTVFFCTFTMKKLKNMNQNSKLFLLDAYALIYRGYYAFIKNPRINSKGFNTSAILGFVNTLEEVLKKENPTHIGVAFDPPGPTFRHEAFEQYKAQREETPEAIRLSVPIIKDIIKAYRIPILEVAGYEADDVIGTLATEAGNQGITTYMMTPDKDYGQLVTDHVFMYRPKYGDKEFEVMGVEQVKAKFDIQSPAQVIGIRTPVLRNFAKAFAKEDGAEAFLQELPHTYYEENNLHMMLIGGIRDYAQCLYEVKRMLPYVDNWATCDFPVPKCFAKHKEELLPEIHTFLASGETYTIRYGIGLLMRLYLDEDFKPEYPVMVASVTSEEYYVNMMIAWYFATALAKQWEMCIPYIEERRLSPWVHRKTIQKAVESYRITDEQKVYLKTFR